MYCPCTLFLFTSCFIPVLYSWEIPRLTLRQDNIHHQLIYSKPNRRTVFFYRDGSEKLYLGGLNYVLEMNEFNVLKNFTLTASKYHSCHESSCENVVTVIEEFQNSLLVCGTNGENPTCWKLDPSEDNQSKAVVESLDGLGISPFKFSQNSLSLVVDGDLYAAAPAFKDGTSIHFRRLVGYRSILWMRNSWITEPTFISAFAAKRYEDPINEKIYILFRERNSDSSPEADPWISRVARVCKVDRGGTKNILQQMWTSFLKARIVCAVPGESLYFNHLQDIFVLHSDNWRNSVVYAVFRSIWNTTAVCTYSLADLDVIFENSSFKNDKQQIPNPRPGTCVEDSRTLPFQTLLVIKNNPEMTDWVHPIQKHAPLYMSNIKYTKIAVDRVLATDGKMYNVLLLSTDTGMIHKILELDSKVFIISETSLSSGSAPVQTMKLNSEKRKLFVGYPGQMSVLDLQRCQDYNTSCQDCVLARDPYCAWTEYGCTSQIQGGIQDIATGDPSICVVKSDPKRQKRNILAESPAPQMQHTTPLGLSFYFTCPIESHHATYSWVYKDISKPCQKIQSECLYLIPKVSTHDYGTYKCISVEHGYKKVIKEYNLFELPVLQAPNSALKLNLEKQLHFAVFCSTFFCATKNKV